MWAEYRENSNLSFNDAEFLIHRLNDNRICGFANWRIPTLEEALSILQKKREHQVCLNNVFEPVPFTTWTVDSIPGESRYWFVNFVDGIFDNRGPFSNRKLNARVVRKL